MANVQMTEDQLARILSALSPRASTAMQGSFAKCTARYSGQRDRAILEDFVTTTTIYKEIENITDDNAIKGLSLLLEDNAAIWWLGVKGTVKTWKKAAELLRDTFAPQRQAHEIYAEIFQTKQDPNKSTDAFIAEIRALFAELPQQLDANTQLDMIYAQLKYNIREKITRDQVATVEQLIEKARTIEKLEQEKMKHQPQPQLQERNEKKGRRCAHCRRPGHTTENGKMDMKEQQHHR
ncbi:Activity-regulated cytoskeleton associated protein 1 [Anthophora retusa]